MNWMLVDGTFMAHRARHTTGGLKHEGRATGLAFGILRDLQLYRELHGIDRTVVAFDGRKSLRKGIYPGYKGSRRKEMTDEEKLELEAFFEELDDLKRNILPEAGYRNVLELEGYEADDILAAAGHLLFEADDDTAVIVTADNDLLQCLTSRVRFWNPITKRTVTQASFFAEWGIDPCQWASVKALAGCPSDDVPGIPGIGEKTAAKWFSGKLKPTDKKYKKISENLGTYNENLKLVTLPFSGIQLPALVADDLTEQRRISLEQKLGIRPRRSSAAAKAKQERIGFF